MTADSEKLVSAMQVKSVFVVGSSASGKTTLVNGLRSPAYRHRVVVPRRFVTRTGRRDDDPSENLHLSHTRFQSRVDAGEIHPYWHRTLEHGRTERYGFESIDKTNHRLRVYSANNALLRDINASVREVLETAILIIVTTRHATREARLSAKDMPEDERTVRLGDDGKDVLDAGLAARFIDTTDLTPLEGQQALRLIADEVFSVALSAAP